MSDVDSILKQESNKHAQDEEIARILSEFLPDAYSVLGLQPGCTTSDIKAQYRKKSLLIHPDRTPNTQAPDAFDRLKKAQDALLDDKRREHLDQAFTDARRLLIRERKWALSDERLKSAAFLRDWREKTREVLVEDELRKRRIEKARMEEEGRQKRKMEEQIEEKRKKREADRAWEDSRDTRVGNWREYRKTISKPKKKKKADLLA